MYVATKGQVVVSRQALVAWRVILGNSAVDNAWSCLKVLVHLKDRPIVRKGFRAAEIGRIAVLFSTSDLAIALYQSRARDTLRPAIVRIPLLERGALP
jgi:hypothetical protein